MAAIGPGRRRPGPPAGLRPLSARPDRRTSLAGVVDLLGLLGVSVRLGGGWPEIPALIPPLFVTLNTPRPTSTPNPNATPGDKATPVPTRSIFWWLVGTPELGEDEGTPHTPAAPKPAVKRPPAKRKATR